MSLLISLFLSSVRSKTRSNGKSNARKIHYGRKECESSVLRRDENGTSHKLINTKLKSRSMDGRKQRYRVSIDLSRIEKRRGRIPSGSASEFFRN